MPGKPTPLVVLRTAKQRSIADMLVTNPGITNSAIARQLDVALATVQRVRDYIRTHPSEYKRGVPTPVSPEKMRARIAKEFISGEQSQENYKGWLKAALPIEERASIRAKIAQMGDRNPVAALKALDWIDAVTGMAPQVAAEAAIAPPLFTLADGASVRIDLGSPGLKRDADDEPRRQALDRKGVVLTDTRTLNSMSLDPPPPEPALALGGQPRPAPGPEAPVPPGRDSGRLRARGLPGEETPATVPPDDTHEEER